MNSGPNQLGHDEVKPKSRMRVGMLTMHFAFNYGGVLQCLALQQQLRQLGASVDVIDYHPNQRFRTVSSASRLLGSSGRQFLMRLLGERRWGHGTYQSFECFRERYLCLTKPINARASLVRQAQEYDTLIVGSDQIWNGRWFMPVYFLDFANQFRGIKMSYGACFGHREQPLGLRERAPAWLREFDSISVRDEMSRELVYSLCGRDAEVVADPTVLVDLTEYAAPYLIDQRDFIVVYLLNRRNTESASRIVRHVKTTLNLPVLTIASPDLAGWRFPDTDLQIEGVGPSEWLDLIGRAAFVCTDSFHGSIFALRHRKPFLIFDDGEPRSERLHDLSQRYSVQARLIRLPTSAMTEEWLLYGINYDLVHDRMAAHRMQSVDYLQRAIGTAG